MPQPSNTSTARSACPRCNVRDRLYKMSGVPAYRVPEVVVCIRNCI